MAQEKRSEQSERSPERAKRAEGEVRKEEEARKTLTKYAVFGLAGEQFAAPVLEVSEIIAEFQITPLPKAPEAIGGVISVRGEIIPVVDLRKRFSLKAKEKDPKTRVIVLKSIGGSPVGMVVDEVIEVAGVDPDTIEAPPPIIASLGLSQEYLSGVSLHRDKLLIILDLEKTLTIAREIKK